MAIPVYNIVFDNIAISAMGAASRKSGTPDDQQFKSFVASDDGLDSLRCDEGGHSLFELGAWPVLISGACGSRGGIAPDFTKIAGSSRRTQPCSLRRKLHSRPGLAPPAPHQPASTPPRARWSEMIDVLALPGSTGHDIVAPWGRFSGLFQVVATPCFIFVARRRVHRRDMTARALESPVLTLQAGQSP